MDWFLYDNGLRHERDNKNINFIDWVHNELIIAKLNA